MAENSPARASSGLDTAIMKALPENTIVVSVERHGVSNWAWTAKINAKAADGSKKSFFLKILRAKDAAERVFGEFMSMAEIYKTMPSFAPQPRGFGKCEDTDEHFFLCDFLFLDYKLPDPVQLGKKLSGLHLKSQSPTGKFGFHCVTYDGTLPLNTAWESDWTIFFTSLLRDVYKLDVNTNGVWKELDDAMKTTLEKLIPRLLDPLVAEGRTIKPCLIHGDLWESNIGTDASTGEIYIFDAAAMYAHHEKEMGMWRCVHHQMHDESYRRDYFKNIAPSEPAHEVDDRNRLYSVETLLVYSAHFPGSETRKKALDELEWLIHKYRDEI